MGSEFPQDHMNDLMEAVKNYSVEGKEVSDSELEAIAHDVLWKKEKCGMGPQLKEMTVVTGMSSTPTATVKISMPDGRIITDSQIGTGPVNAALNAIRKALNPDMTLEEYKLSAITGGSDSLCQV